MFGQKEDGVLSKEERRIQIKREAAEQRRLRLMNPRYRAIGLDVDALDNQVAEIQKNREDMKQADLMDRLRLQEIDRVLEAQAEEERGAKSAQLRAIKQSWDQSLATKRSLETKPSPIDLDRVGPSAVQVFSGEDRQRDERIRAQKLQMRRWIQEQVAEKAYKKEVERSDDLVYSDMLKSIDGIREEAEKEEEMVRKTVMRETISQNEAIKQQKRERQTKEDEFKRLPLEEQLKATSLDLFNEPATTLNASGKIRKDIFKGFTSAQTRRIFQENEAVIQQHRDRKEDEAQREREWASQQALLARALEQAHLEEADAREMEKQRHLEVLNKQKDGIVANRFIEKQTVGIGAEFFNNFGKSHR